MSATLLINELSNLVSEAKRKNNDLRNAADKSLQELKGLPNTSEQQLAADLSRRPAFIEPLLVACATKSPKFAGIGVSCLQRLVISKALPKSRLNDALDAFNACTELGLDVQLKTLQALPSLLQNYAEDLKGDLLAGALQVCASLQSSKVQTVSGVASATLQQLVTAIFEKVLAEDRRPADVPTIAEVPGNDGSIALRPAAFDAYRVFRDLVLTAEGRKTKFVNLSTLTAESSLDLLWSCIQGNQQLFRSHTELISVIRSNLLPLITRALSEKLAFPMTARSMRIFDLLLTRYFPMYHDECEVALGLMTQNLEFDTSATWRRALVMEVIRNFFATGGLAADAYAVYDQAKDGRPIVQDILSAFVRMSAERPTVIGLGQQSTVPIGPHVLQGSGSERAALETGGGMAGVIGSALGVVESNVTGISSQWSTPRTALLEQLDKTDPPVPPETYVYTMALDCLNSLSDSLARIVLPVTVRHANPSSTDADGAANINGVQANETPMPQIARSQSFRERAVPVNPLELDDGPTKRKISAVAGLVDNCWPAVLATSSTFLNAALEEQYYRTLIKAYQRFTQVAGLLRLGTARDALMTTLSKSAIPPHIVNAAVTDAGKSPVAESPRVFSNSKGLLSVDSLISHASSMSIERERQSSIEHVRPMLTTRNLLCLRALLNLAIALGPTLETAFAIVVDALRQADVILSAAAPQHMLRQGSAASLKGGESPAALQAFSAEVAAVEGAASRLLESTADYPNGAFVNVLKAFVRLLSGISLASVTSPTTESAVSPPPTPKLRERTTSGLQGISTLAELQARDYRFVIPKLGTLAELNVARFGSNDPEESGWIILVKELADIATGASRPQDARRAATGVLCNMAAQSVAEVIEENDQRRATVQRRSFAVLLQLVDGIYAEEGDLTTTDLGIQTHVLDTLRSILERCGDSISAGWNKILAILSSAFERTENALNGEQHDVETRINWSHITNEVVSPQIGKVAFAATQLVCSDFLAALPTAVVPSLVELLYRFTGQTDDLNIALTTVTIVWNVSDFLFTQIEGQELDAFADLMRDAESPEDEMSGFARASRPAQLVLILQRLRDAVSDMQKEVRNAAFHTICSIFKNHGNNLSPKTWDVLLRSIVLRVALSDVRLRINFKDNSGPNGSKAGWIDEELSKAIITGTSEIMAQHLRLIEQVAKLPSLWEIFLNAMEAYLDAARHVLSAAVYNATLRVLIQIDGTSSIWTTPTYRTMALWMKRIPEEPESAELRSGKTNQDAYIAYVETAAELHRLTKDSMGASQVRKMVDNLYYCIQHSNGPSYGGDVNVMSSLQAKVLDLLKNMRTDLANIPSRLIAIAGQLSVLCHDTSRTNLKGDGPTFVALASESIDWLQSLLLKHLDDPEVIDTGALLSGLQSLRRLILEKYAFRTGCKGVQLWRKATDAALAVVEPVLTLAETPRIAPSVRTSLWAESVGIATGVMSAKSLDSVDDMTKVYEDQLFDIDSFERLRQMLVPRLGDAALPDAVRDLYCRSLFEASIVHALEPEELQPSHLSPLADINKLRRGRVKNVPFAQRERMCYVCFRELITLASRSDSSSERRKLAQAAAPLLILRLAIPIRAYIADQPLQGRRPQPLSELEELLFCFDEIKKLELNPEALTEDSIASGRKGATAHIPFLYPLLTKAVATAGDRWSGTREVLVPLQSVLEATATAVHP